MGQITALFDKDAWGKEYISLRGIKLYNCQSQASKEIVFSPKPFSSSNYIWNVLHAIENVTSSCGPLRSLGGTATDFIRADLLLGISVTAKQAWSEVPFVTNIEQLFWWQGIFQKGTVVAKPFERPRPAGAAQLWAISAPKQQQRQR